MIEHGMIGLVSTIKSKRKFLTRGIQICEGSMWNHAFLVLDIDGELYAYEEGTIFGITITPLSEYLEAEKKGELILCFAKLKNKNVTKEINKYCYSLIGKDMYAFWQIHKQAIRQNLQKIGIDWIYKSKGFICSVLVTNILNKYYEVFKNWMSFSPDDIHKSDEIVFIQH